MLWRGCVKTASALRIHNTMPLIGAQPETSCQICQSILWASLGQHSISIGTLKKIHLETWTGIASTTGVICELVVCQGGCRCTGNSPKPAPFLKLAWFTRGSSLRWIDNLDRVIDTFWIHIQLPVRLMKSVALEEALLHIPIGAL